MRALLAIALLAACGGGSKSSSTTPKKAPVTCATTADGMMAMMMEGKEGNKERVEEAADGFKAIIRTRCEQDSWTAEAQQCLSTMKTRTDAERCSTMLTEEQQANLVRDQKAKYGAGSPSPDEPKPDPEVAKESPVTPAGAPPPPMKAEEKPTKADKKRGAPAKKPGKTGDPCDGGE